MSKHILSILKTAPTILGISVLIANSPVAAQTLTSPVVVSQTVAPIPDESSSLCMSNIIQTQACEEITQKGEREKINTKIGHLSLDKQEPRKNRKISQNIHSSLSRNIGISSPTPVNQSIKSIKSNILAQAISQKNQTTSPNTETLEQINRYSQQDNNLRNDAMNKINSVDRLEDVSPGDWAYEALRSLAEKYNCLSGYPDNTYRGNQTLNRYEFAVAFNSCVQEIEQIIAKSNAELVSTQDLTTVQRLQEEFKTQLTTLRGRIDNLENNFASVENNQFSTTTKLGGEVILDLTAFSGDEKADGSGEKIDDNFVISNRVRLNFKTSFTGKDLLFTRIQSGNFERLRDVTGTNTVGRSFLGTGDNNAFIKTLFYRFPVGEDVEFTIGTTGIGWTTLADTVNPYFKFGSMSFFTNRNPAVYNIPGGQGVGASIFLSDSIDLNVGYLTRSANSPDAGEGLFNGSYSAAAQLNFTFAQSKIAFTYARTYESTGEVFLAGGVGSPLAGDPFEGESAVSGNRFGIQANWAITNGVNLGGWVGYVDALAQSGSRKGDRADVWNWFANITFPDFGKDGSVLGFGVGMPPKATRVTGGPQDKDTSTVLEGFYRYSLTDNITLIPGAFVILNPNHDADNDPIFVGRLRTVFRF